MTIFRDEFDTRFVVMFTVLLFLKVFHWLCQDRIDSMEQSPGLPASFHVRMVTMMSFLIYIDAVMVSSAIAHFMKSPPNMMIMFAFEYTLLATSLAASFGKYALHTIDMQSEEPWENKSMLLFYLDLLADFVKLATYMMFFVVILMYYGLPVHIIRDVYMTLRSFLQKCKDLVQYRMATRNMNERYPDATPTDLAALSDPICIICREEMVSVAQPAPAAPAREDANGNPARPATPRSAALNNVPKKLPCGHIFHFHCLKSWLERQQSCPTCRRMVLDPPTPGQPTPGNVAPAAAGGAGAEAGAAAAGAGGAAGRVGAGGGGGAAAMNGVPGAGFNANGQPNGAPGVPGQGVAPGGQGQLPHGVGFPLFFGLPGHHLAMGGIHPYFMGGIPAGGPIAAVNPAAPVGGAGGEGRQVQGGAAHVNAPPTYTLPHVTHPIPGLIPLFPIEQHPIAADPLQQQQQQQTGATAGMGEATNGASTSHSRSTTGGASTGAPISSTGRLATDQIPLTSLDSLSETQLHHLESNTRRALQERLRVLQAVEHQIVDSVTVLTQVLSVLPQPPSPLPRLQQTSSNTEACDPPSPDFTAQGLVAPLSATTPSMLTSSTSSLSTASTSTVNADEATTSNRTTTTTTTMTTTVTSSSSSSSSSIAIAAPTPSVLTSGVPLLSTMEAEMDNLSSSTTAGAAGQTTATATAMEPMKMEKGKGKKKEQQQQQLEDDEDAAAVVAAMQEELEKEEGGGGGGGGGGLGPLMSSTLTGTDLSDFEQDMGEDDDDDDESALSPQEMVRRRWAKLQQEQQS
ncbi:E3 ubiquitin-protein ligase hrd1 [Actinomortierella ambigua]|uniref:RING-type E3 ubiquitin transferase n=1 Tax=Actinomortierella ambigua TaxID=1343610 RepID=A0A9P6UCA4_9FUNG|nr:E3 ubiquitin-protein ligase hrd1 [Actinomortierella ambigua]